MSGHCNQSHHETHACHADHWLPKPTALRRNDDQLTNDGRDVDLGQCTCERTPQRAADFTNRDCSASHAQAAEGSASCPPSKIVRRAEPAVRLSRIAFS